MGTFNISKIHKQIQISSHQYQKLYSTLPQHGTHTWTIQHTPTTWYTYLNYTAHSHNMVHIPELYSTLPQHGTHTWTIQHTPTTWYTYLNYTAHSHNMVHIPELYSTLPQHGTHTCKVLRKYSNASSSYSTKMKCDRLMDGRGAFQYLPSRAFGMVGDNKRLPVCSAKCPLKASATIYIYIHEDLPLYNINI